MSGWGGHNKPGAGGLQQQGFALLGVWGPEVQEQGLGRAALPPEAPWGFLPAASIFWGFRSLVLVAAPPGLCLWGHAAFSSSVSVPGVSLVRTPRRSRVISCRDPCLRPQRLIPNAVPLTRPRDRGVAAMQPTTPAPAMRPGWRLLLLGLKTERAEDPGPTPASPDTLCTAPVGLPLQRWEPLLWQVRRSDACVQTAGLGARAFLAPASEMCVPGGGRQEQSLWGTGGAVQGDLGNGGLNLWRKARTGDKFGFGGNAWGGQNNGCDTVTLKECANWEGTPTFRERAGQEGPHLFDPGSRPTGMSASMCRRGN